MNCITYDHNWLQMINGYPDFARRTSLYSRILVFAFLTSYNYSSKLQDGIYIYD